MENSDLDTSTQDKTNGSVAPAEQEDNDGSALDDREGSPLVRGDESKNAEIDNEGVSYARSPFGEDMIVEEDCYDVGDERSYGFLSNESVDELGLSSSQQFDFGESTQQVAAEMKQIEDHFSYERRISELDTDLKNQKSEVKDLRERNSKYAGISEKLRAEEARSAKLQSDVENLNKIVEEKEASHQKVQSEV